MAAKKKRTKRRWSNLAEANLLLAYRRARRARWIFFYLTQKERIAIRERLSEAYNKERRRSLKHGRAFTPYRGEEFNADEYIKSNDKHLASLDAYIAFLRNEVLLRRWVAGEPYECYDVYVKWLGSVESPAPRVDLYFAYRQFRAFHIAAKAAPIYFDALCDRRSVPISRQHAVETTRVVKLLLGERGYRAAAKDTGQHGWCWDDRLVNKVASVLALADLDNVAPSEMPAWIKAQGGLQACLARFRQSQP